MKMWSHEFNYSDRFQAAALEDYDELPPDHALPPSNSTPAAITATASYDAPSSEHSHEVPHKNNDSRIMQDGVLAAIVELSRRTPPQPPILRADAWYRLYLLLSAHIFWICLLHWPCDSSHELSSGKR